MKIFAKKLLNPSYFTYAEDKTPLAPDSVTAEGGYHFDWMTAFDVGVDVHFDPMPKTYIGAISVKFSAPAVSGVEVLVDGKVGGCYFGEDGALIEKTDCGEDLTLLVYPWDNPCPEKKITKIAYKAVNENVHPILTNAEILTKTK